MGSDKFAVFILTHGRPDKVITYKALQRQGYTGPVYLIVDDEDKTLPEYRRIYGEQVVTFNKAEIAARFDEGDNFNDRRSVFYARNACWDIAAWAGVDYFLQLDDDYTDFRYKFNAHLGYKEIYGYTNLDRLFSIVLSYYKNIPALTLAFAQTGDFIGGGMGASGKDLHLKRKAMNTFVCSVNRPFDFVGRVNEDVNTYVSNGNRGGLFLTFPNVAIQQNDTQQNAGGMTDLYNDSGTYIKSFYTVMYAPSCVKISEIGTLHKRIHHRINWNSAVPKIVNEALRKP